MTSWLLATELGGGLGHLMRLRHLAGALKQPGDRIVVAAHDVAAAKAIFSGVANRIVRAPPLPLLREQPRPGFEGILEAFGFGEARILRKVTRHWQRIATSVGADMMIADFAPFATLAMRDMLPIAQIGSGFDLPPAHQRHLPPFVPSDIVPRQPALLANARGVARVLGATPPTTLPQAVSVASRYLVSLPWIDPFEGRRAEVALGPLGPRPPLRPAPAEGRIFVYTDPDAPSFDTLAKILAQLPVKTSIYWRNGAASIRSLLDECGLETFTGLPDPAVHLPRATLVINHGGAGMISDALFAGRAQICLPYHLESTLNANAVAALGAAVVPSDYHADTLYWTIMNSLNDIALRDRALEWGERAQYQFGRDPAVRIARSIRRQLAVAA